MGRLGRIAEHRQHIGVASRQWTMNGSPVSLRQPQMPVEIILLHVEAACRPSSGRAPFRPIATTADRGQPTIASQSPARLATA